MSVSVLVPFRPGVAQRDLVWSYLRGLWIEAGFDVVDRPGPDGWFSRSAALNAARAATSADLLVIIDADTYVTPAQVATALAHVNTSDSVPTVIARDCRHLNKQGSDLFMQGERRREILLGQQDWSWENSTPMALRAEHFDEVGGFDERIYGWGEEDVAFNICLETLFGKARTLEGDAWHLWHPGQDTSRKEENARISSQYRAAMGDPARIRALRSTDS